MKMSLSVVSEGDVVSVQLFDVEEDKRVHRLVAVDEARYVINDPSGRDGLSGMKIGRFGKNLAVGKHIEHMNEAALVIEDFFGRGGKLAFQHADGQEYVCRASATGDLIDAASLDDGGTAQLGPIADSITMGAGYLRAAEDNAAPTLGAVSGVSHGEGRSAPACGETAAAALDLRSTAFEGDRRPANAEFAAAVVAHDVDENTAESWTSIDDTPIIDGLYDDHGVFTGLIANGGYTDDGRPDIVGRTEPGMIVHVYDGVSLLGHSIADGNGDWVFTPLYPLADGRHEITIILQDQSGASSEESEPYVIFVDRVTPEPPVILGMVDDEGRITGLIADQGITDDNRPAIHGVAEANATVIIYDKGQELDRVTVGPDGNWSFTPAAPLADGLHILSYAVMDAAGNASERSEATEFLVDTRAEKISIYYADDTVGSVVGAVLDGGVTDDSMPTLSGTATAGGLVRIYEGSVLLGEVLADVDGTWRFAPEAALSEGAHTFQATVSLAAKGESERSSPFDLLVDLTAPQTPSIEQVLDDVGSTTGPLEQGMVTDDSMPTLVGKAEAWSTVHVLGNGIPLGSAVADAVGRWTYTPSHPLSDGPHHFTVTTVDSAGNISQSSMRYTIIVDATAPAAPVIDAVQDDQGSWTGKLLAGDETDDSRPGFEGRAEPDSTVVIKDHGAEIGRVKADAEGRWAFTPESDLADGSHLITAEAIDAAGNSSAQSDGFHFSIAPNGDDHPRHLVASQGAGINATLLIETSGSMFTERLPSVKNALHQMAEEYLDAAGGEVVSLTLLSTGSPTPVKFEFSSVLDQGYKKYINAVNALVASGSPSYELAVNATMNSIMADYQSGEGPRQIFILGDAGSPLSRATADKWQAMLLNPTGSAELDIPIRSTPISFKAFPHALDYSYHWLATDGQAIDTPSSEMLPEILLGVFTGDKVSGNLLENDVKLQLDGNEYLTEVTFEDGSFSIAPNNTLVMRDVDAGTVATYKPDTGLLTIKTVNGVLRIYMRASGEYQAGDYTYVSNDAQLYYGESAKEEIFGYLAVDGCGMSQSAKLHIVIEPCDVTKLLTISRLGKDSGVAGDFVTADGSAGRELSGTLTHQLAKGLKVQVSVDGGKTWLDAVTHGWKWTFIDTTAHSSSWTVQVRVSDGVTHGATVLTQEVVLVESPGAPTIIGIPDAEGIYTAPLARDGSEMTVSLLGTGAKVGDTIHIQWGSSTYDQVLTQVDISNGEVSLNVPASVTYSTSSFNYDFRVTAQIIGQDGTIGALSAPHSVVGTYARVLASDGLLLAPVDDVYTGNGFTVTTTGSMAKAVATTSSLAGLLLTDSLQANARFTLDQPVDQIALRLSGADNASGVEIRVFDVNGDLLHQQMVFGDASALHIANFSWAKTGVMDIGSFTVTASSASVTLDSFSHYVVTHTRDTRDPNVIDVLAETFYGSDGDDVVSLSQYAPTYFGHPTAAIHGGGGTDTLKVLGANQLLDMTAAAERISSMEVIDLTGVGNNTLTLNLSDVLRNGGTDIFHAGDRPRVQMMVQGNVGDKVNLGDLLVDGVDHGDWVKQSAVVIGAATYDAYQHSSLAAELLVQQGITIVVSNSSAVGISAVQSSNANDELLQGGPELLSVGSDAVATSGVQEVVIHGYPGSAPAMTELKELELQFF